MNYILLEDIASASAKIEKATAKKPARYAYYGMKGDVVELISIRGEVAIVKGKQTFPVRVEKIRAL
jgi:hypothetical protein